jgi:hypothetical protein
MVRAGRTDEELILVTGTDSDLFGDRDHHVAA